MEVVGGLVGGGRGLGLMAGGQRHLPASSVRVRVHPPGQLSATLCIVINITTTVVVVIVVTLLTHNSLLLSDEKDLSWYLILFFFPLAFFTIFTNFCKNSKTLQLLEIHQIVRFVWCTIVDCDNVHGATLTWQSINMRWWHCNKALFNIYGLKAGGQKEVWTPEVYRASKTSFDLRLRC